MTPKEIREKDSASLVRELTDKQRHLFDLHSQAVTEKLENPSQLKKARQDIARIKTVLRERELATGKNAPQAVTATEPAAT